MRWRWRCGAGSGVGDLHRPRRHQVAQPDQGHQFVDGVIRNAAMAIRTSLRRIADRDMVCRRGDAADEFLVILDGVNRKLAAQLAEQMLTSLRSLPTAVTASIGVATRHGDLRMSAADLERAAEIAMDQAKADGKNCVRPILPGREAGGGAAVASSEPEKTTRPRSFSEADSEGRWHRGHFLKRFRSKSQSEPKLPCAAPPKPPRQSSY